MRLWHKDLIDVLPRQQLLSQWRECCAIASNIANKGTPNHMLVNKVMEYPQIHFIVYVNKILDEMRKRSYNVSGRSYVAYVNNMRLNRDHFKNGILIDNNIFPDWMDKRYLKQCYYNLQEKYDCGGITDEEWNRIQNKVWKEVEG